MLRRVRSPRGATGSSAEPRNPEDVAGGGAADDPLAIAAGLREFFDQSAHPRDLLSHPEFARGVAAMESGRSTAELLDYYTGGNPIVACMALEALARRDDDTDLVAPILAAINDRSFWQRWFALRTLAARVKEPLVGAVLTRVDESWLDPFLLGVLAEFVAGRIAAGEAPTFGDHLATLDAGRIAHLGELLRRLGERVPAPLHEELHASQRSRLDLDALRAIGRVWGDDPAATAREVIEHPALVACVEEVLRQLLREPSRSVLLVGEAGVGKTAAVRALAERLARRGVPLFEAGATELMAGMSFVGQLEQRVQVLIGQLGGKDVVWYVPRFHELLWAGRHQYSPTGLLDQLLPHIESGELRVVGELRPAALERLLQQHPSLRSAVVVVRMAPLGSEETLELARQWAERRTPAGGPPRIDAATLAEAYHLARQYLVDRAAPGNLLQFLELAERRRITAGADPAGAITLDDLLDALSRLTGLPLSVLDERRGLDLEGLRAFFARRVLGQPEAVECLVERVAMIKAGLTDPSRPLGVFLFVGPTGTGKTELAKAAAEYLFGSADRMIRLDMSEFQTPESLDRLLGDRSDVPDGTALVHAVRRQPFSLLLLDEFEKAHPAVWDLFLQVFDDGRLTDRRGNTADFRHTIIIMTSNLGAAVSAGSAIGFARPAFSFSPATVQKVLAETFRPEFLNRIDRIVVFRPLGPSLMRELLHKELTDVLHRRGLRNRQWAIEWEESALDLLLRKGFSPELGARPLRRAVEQYFLAPLALTIVNREVPEGDQFLFVRAEGDALEVEFVDPDAAGELPDAEAAPAAVLADGAAALRLEDIVLDGTGTRAEVEALEAEYEHLRGIIEADAWRERKDAALASMAAPGFWDSPERFATLGLAEYMDRIEVGLDTAGSLLQRLTGGARGERARFPRDLVRRLAQQLYLVGEACEGLFEGRPRDAFLLVRASRSGEDAELSDAFARRLGDMYRAWAKKRRMRLEVLEESAGGGEPYRLLLAISGFGAFTILEPEAGYHVLEVPDEGRTRRARVLVRVAPQPEEPPPAGRGGPREQALRAFSREKREDGGRDARAARDAREGGARQGVGSGEGREGRVIVRRYRERPSPLVRDSVRGWRTGRLDRVLGGDFDLM
ncbi:MAG TPA: AAA family ATPase [Longimicrobiales bacterium]